MTAIYGSPDPDTLTHGASITLGHGEPGIAINHGAPGAILYGNSVQAFLITGITAALQLSTGDFPWQ